MAEIDLMDFRRGAKVIPLDGSDSKSRRPRPAPNPFDTDDQRKQLSVIEGWWLEQIDAHAENRREQLTDWDFYDHEQWDEHAIRVLAKRNQAAQNFNLIKPVIDWIVGTERRTRVDWSVFPRGEGAEKLAEIKADLLKFISDANGTTFHRSKAFKDMAVSGVGWTRSFARTSAKKGIPVANRYLNWKSIRWDPYGQADDMSDWRSINIERYFDLDYAIALFPDREYELRAAASKMIDPSLEFLTDDALMPQVFFGQKSSLMPMAAISGTMSVGRRQRPRVRLIETEYRRPIVAKVIRDLVDDYSELSGALYDPKDPDMNDLLSRKKITLEDRIDDRMWLATWHPGFFCNNEPSPYKHNEFSVTPMWGYRRHRDGLPYGIVRGIRDPQEEYNKRRSKALFAMSVNRVTYEESAIDEADEDEVLEEASKPDGQIRLRDGAMTRNAFKIENNIDVGEAHIKLMDQARRDIHEGSGVTEENLGISKSEQSGRAILAKQQQGAVGTAELFDNYRQSIQHDGQKTLSLGEQYITAPVQIRITGKSAIEWLKINQPMIDPLTGEVNWENDITKDEADFVVDEQDYRETVRMAMAEMLMDTISKMPPELAIQLLDLAIDMTDIPNREEFVQRIKQINGAAQREQQTPEDQAQAAAEQEQQAQQQQADAQAQRDALTAKTQETLAKADKLRADAKKAQADAAHTNVRAKGEAMNVAESVHKKPSLAPAADRINEEPLPAGEFSRPGTTQVQAAPNPSGIEFPPMIAQH